ncbi:MAG: hypothetical protein AB7O24_15805 [Kofleriaceae bacterium]
MRIAMVFMTVGLWCMAACGEDPKVVNDAGVDTGGPADASCFENPQTHEEIINGCTTAQKIYKTSNPPLLNANGTLPPLP